MTANPVGSNSNQATGAQADIGHGKPTLKAAFSGSKTEFTMIVAAAKPHPAHKTLANKSSFPVRTPNEIENHPPRNNL